MPDLGLVSAIAVKETAQASMCFNVRNVFNEPRVGGPVADDSSRCCYILGLPLKL